MADERKPPDISEALNPLDAMAFRVLRNTTLRALVHPKPTGEVSEEEAIRRLDPFIGALHHDAGVFREIFRQAFLMGVERVHAEMHGAPGIDSEMLDEAFTFWSHPRDDDGEALR